jgi:hypothetical protein
MFPDVSATTEAAAPVPVNRHRGEPGRTRDTHAVSLVVAFVVLTFTHGTHTRDTRAHIR